MQQQQLTLDLTVGPVPVAPKQEVYNLVIKWLDRVQVGRKFGPFEIQSHIIAVTGGKKRPQDGTITRYIRKYNEQGGHIENISRSRSTYVKTEERKVNQC
jgi:hypothetical protein